MFGANPRRKERAKRLRDRQAKQKRIDPNKTKRENEKEREKNRTNQSRRKNLQRIISLNLLKQKSQK